MKLVVNRIVQDVASRSKKRWGNGKWKIVGTGMGLGAAGIVHFASKDPDRWPSVLAVCCPENWRAEMASGLKCPTLLPGNGSGARCCAVCGVGNPVQ